MTPKQGRLPGTEDPKIQEIHEAAEAYVDVRDKRIALSQKEGEVKKDLLAVLHKHKKKTYHFEDDDESLDIEIVPEGEKLKVRRQKKVEEAEA